MKINVPMMTRKRNKTAAKQDVPKDPKDVPPCVRATLPDMPNIYRNNKHCDNSGLVYYYVIPWHDAFKQQEGAAAAASEVGFYVLDYS